MERMEIEDSKDATEVRVTEEPPRKGGDTAMYGMDATDFGDDQGSSIKDFFKPSGATGLEDSVEAVLDNPGLLTEEQLINLHAILQHYLPDTVKYDANFDFSSEVTAQITAVRAMRMRVMNANGTLKQDVTVREAKEVIGACTTLLTTLMRHHKTIQNFDRQRSLEYATVEAIKTLPEKNQRLFYETFDHAIASCDE